MDISQNKRGELLDEISKLRHENSLLQTKLTYSNNGDLFKKMAEITSTINIIYQGDRILYVNTAATKTLGYSEEELLQSKFKDFIHPDFHKIEAENRLSLKKREKESANFEIKIITKNGAETWLDFNICPFIWNDMEAFIGFANDITKRKDIEDELIKFKLCIERSFEAIFITDTEGHIVFINPAFEQMYKFSSEEALGKTPRIIKSGSYHEDVYQNFWHTLLSKKVAAGEIINKTKDGKLITIEGFNTSILDSKGGIYGYIGIHRDITTRKKTEESLKLFRTLIDHSNDSIEVLDPATGRFLDVNETGCKELGYSRDEFLKLSVFDIDPMVSPQSFFEIVKELRKSNFITWEGIHNRKDGTSFPVEVNIRIANLAKEYMVTVVRDISQRKQNEELVLKLSRAVEQSPTSVMITDDKGIIEYINPKLTEVTGYKKEEVLGKNPRIFSSGEKPKSEYKILWENINSGKNWKGEFHNKKKNGELFWELAHLSPIININGEITHFVAIKEDITLRKQTEKELIIAKEKAEESDRLKSAFLTNMSHEIRTPMNGILGFAGLMKKPNLTGERQLEYIKIIEKSSARMLNIINEIMDISKIESGQMEIHQKETSIKELMMSVFEIFKLDADEKKIILTLNNDIETNEAYVYTDKDKLYSIITNLVKNAIKYTDVGLVEFGYNRTGNSFKFYVKDTGIGIPPDRKEAIFERFIQADIADIQARQGAGLGLSISKAFVEMLGGKIWFESEQGKGSAFYFTLPLSAEKVEQPIFEKVIPINIENNHIKNLKILIVEDDETSRMFLSLCFKEFCKDLTEARTGHEAVRMCQSNPDIDLIMMDVQIPEMNGYEVTQQIRKFNKDVIIIAQTAFGLSGDKEMAINAGCDDYISKPFNCEELYEMIQKYF